MKKIIMALSILMLAISLYADVDIFLGGVVGAGGFADNGNSSFMFGPTAELEWVNDRRWVDNGYGGVYGGYKYLSYNMSSIETLGVVFGGYENWDCLIGGGWDSVKPGGGLMEIIIRCGYFGDGLGCITMGTSCTWVNGTPITTYDYFGNPSTTTPTLEIYRGWIGLEFSIPEVLKQAGQKADEIQRTREKEKTEEEQRQKEELLKQSLNTLELQFKQTKDIQCITQALDLIDPAGGIISDKAMVEGGAYSVPGWVSDVVMRFLNTKGKDEVVDTESTTIDALGMSTVDFVIMHKGKYCNVISTVTKRQKIYSIKGKYDHNITEDLEDLTKTSYVACNGIHQVTIKDVYNRRVEGYSVTIEALFKDGVLQDGNYLDSSTNSNCRIADEKIARIGDVGNCISFINTGNHAYRKIYTYQEKVMYQYYDWVDADTGFVWDGVTHTLQNKIIEK